MKRRDVIGVQPPSQERMAWLDRQVIDPLNSKQVGRIGDAIEAVGPRVRDEHAAWLEALLTMAWERRAYWTSQLELSLRYKSPQSTQLPLTMLGRLDQRIVALEQAKTRTLAEMPRAKPASRFRRRKS